jgi:hypothetical protein
MVRRLPSGCVHKTLLHESAGQYQPDPSQRSRSGADLPQVEQDYSGDQHTYWLLRLGATEEPDGSLSAAETTAIRAI